MARIFNGGFETGTTGQYASTQFGSPGVAPTVVTSPVAKGAYACRYEIRPGDAEFGGGHRCETLSGDEPTYGSKRWYRLRFRLHEYGTSHWMIIWQAHDTNDTTAAFDIQVAANVAAGSKSFTWTFGASTKYAAGGILLTGFPPIEAIAPAVGSASLLGVGR